MAFPHPTPRLWNRAAVLRPNERFLVFMGSRLSASWEGSYAGTAIANTHEMVTFWWELKVIGEDRVTVPAGAFDCWKVVHLADGEPDLVSWVDKRSGWIVREELTNGRYERVLLSYRDI